MINERAPGVFKTSLLYVFGASMALYPPFAQFAQPFILVSFLSILFVVLYGIAFQNKHLEHNLLHMIVAVLTLVYATWGLVATLYGNDTTYILQDSLGFLVYLLTPVIYLFVRSHHLGHQLCTLILRLCCFIAAVTIGVVAWYYLTYGVVESESLLILNAGLKASGLNWVIDHNGGLLGVYTYTAHFFLLGLGLAFYFYCVSGQRRYLGMIFLFILGIFADGHRALVVAMFLLAAILLPLVWRMFALRRLLTYFTLLAIPFCALILSNLDWIIERFNFTDDDPSTLERSSQIPALLDKIYQHLLLGNGFGSFARVIRSPERPFLYEVDFLATLMKLGLIGSILYFGAYLYMLNAARRRGGLLGYVLFAVGLSFLFYMGTNGGLAMSSDSAIFHMFLFVLIALAIDRSSAFESANICAENLNMAPTRQGERNL